MNTAILAAVWFGTEVFDADRLAEMLFRFLIDLVFAGAIIAVYFRRARNAEYTTTFFVFNVSVFFLVYIMNGLDLDVGFGFGLFALFAVLRFRTTPIPYRELTIAFAVIAVAVVNAISVGALTWAEVLVANLAIALCVVVVGGWWISRQLGVQQVRYERIAHVRPDRKDELLADLRDRTGLDVVSVRVDEIDFLNDTAVLQVTYRRPQISW
jgi:hypothetical protein